MSDSWHKDMWDKAMDPLERMERINEAYEFITRQQNYISERLMHKFMDILTHVITIVEELQGPGNGSSKLNSAVAIVKTILELAGQLGLAPTGSAHEIGEITVAIHNRVVEMNEAGLLPASTKINAEQISESPFGNLDSDEEQRMEIIKERVRQMNRPPEIDLAKVSRELKG